MPPPRLSCVPRAEVESLLTQRPDLAFQFIQRLVQCVVPGPLSQARIAERLGASKAMVNRLLQDRVPGGCAEVSPERNALAR